MSSIDVQVNYRRCLSLKVPLEYVGKYIYFDLVNPLSKVTSDNLDKSIVVYTTPYAESVEHTLILPRGSVSNLSKQVIDYFSKLEPEKRNTLITLPLRKRTKPLILPIQASLQWGVVNIQFPKTYEGLFVYFHTNKGKGYSVRLAAEARTRAYVRVREGGSFQTARRTVVEVFKKLLQDYPKGEMVPLSLVLDVK